MRLIVTIALTMLMLTSAQAQEAELTTFLLTRHAEKAKEGGRDPVLSKQGVERAKALAAALKHTDVDLIISTPFKRTRQTVQLLATQKALTTQEYDYRNPKLLEDLINQYAGKTIVISGHSNTTPFLVNQLVGSEQFEQLDESDYGKLFIVTCSKVGDGKAIVVNYGKIIDSALNGLMMKKQ